MLRALQTTVMEQTAALDRRGAEPNDLENLAEMQGELADLADDLIRRMSQ